MTKTCSPTSKKAVLYWKPICLADNLLLSRQKYLKAMQSANTVKFLFRKHVTSYEAKLQTRMRHSRCEEKKAVQVSMILRVGTFSKAILLHCKVITQADNYNSL